MGRWIRIDRRYNQPYRLTTYASHAIFKWTGLILAWVFVNAVLTAIHLGALVLVTTGGLIWYAIHCAQRNRRTQLAEPAYRPVIPMANQQQVSTPPSWYCPSGRLVTRTRAATSPFLAACLTWMAGLGANPFSNSMAGLGTNTSPNSRSTR